MRSVTDQLLEEAIQLFDEAFDKLIAAVGQTAGQAKSGGAK